MDIYERYFARQVYLAFIFILFAFSGLFFFFDLISELNAVGHGNYKFTYAVLRVLLLTPSRFYEIIPVAALISAIYVYASMAATSEYTILRVSGLSTARSLGTLLKIGVPMVLMTFLVEVISPYTDQLSERVRLSALGSAVSSDFKSGVWVKDTLTSDSGGQRLTRFVNVGELTPDTAIHNVRIFEFDEHFRLNRIRVAQQGTFVAPNHWRLTDVEEMQLDGVAAGASAPASASGAAGTSRSAGLATTKGASAAGASAANAAASELAPAAKGPRGLNPIYRSSLTHEKAYLMRSELTPQILSVLLVAPDRMSIMNLMSYIGHLEENHQDAQRYKIALWRKFLYPFAVFVMLVLALPFAYLHTRAGVVGVKVFGGIMLGMSFQLINTLFSHIGTLNTWPAPLTTAAPSIIYLAVGLLVLRRVD